MEAAYFRESLEAVRTELEQLLTQHWRDVAFHEGEPPQPNWDMFATAADAGKLRIFTARVAGELIGFCAFLVLSNLHYKSSLQAVQEVLVLAPKYRNGPIAAHLILFAERQMRDDGVQVVYHKASQHFDIGPPLERLGYEVIDAEWGKRLNRAREPGLWGYNAPMPLPDITEVLRTIDDHWGKKKGRYVANALLVLVVLALAVWLLSSIVVHVKALVPKPAPSLASHPASAENRSAVPATSLPPPNVGEMTDVTTYGNGAAGIMVRWHYNVKMQRVKSYKNRGQGIVLEDQAAPDKKEGN